MCQNPLDYKIKRNTNKELYGKTKCIICNKTFEFIENKNSSAIAIGTESMYEGNKLKLFVRLNMTSKCPNCGYNIQHYQIEENETLE